MRRGIAGIRLLMRRVEVDESAHFGRHGRHLRRRLVGPGDAAGGGRRSEPSSQDRYLRTRQRMTAEVNAAVEGALAGGADEVIVNDSHDGMRNLIPDELHPAVRFITGNDKPLGMVQGVDLDGVGALFYTGYHAKAGTPPRRWPTPGPAG